MKIEELKINGYGNIKNKNINLDNINIIYGKNESGKSTVLSYIKNMFYGISKNKNGKDISEYEKYKPWSGEEYSGKLKYKLDNEKEYEIYRDFNKKSPKIFNSNMEDISVEFDTDKKDGSQFFYTQTGIDENIFTSTVLTEQQEVKLNEQKQSILIQKIANITATGDSEISYNKVKERLNKKQLEEIGTDRTQGKPINLLKNRIKNVELQLEKIKELKKEQINVEEDKNRLKNRIEENERRKDIIKQINILNEENKLEKERINYKLEINKEKEEKIKKLEEQKEDIEDIKIKIKSGIFGILLLIILSANIINAVFIKKSILTYVFLSLIPVLLIGFSIYAMVKKNNLKNAKKNELKLIDKQIEAVREEKSEIQKEIEIKENKILNKQQEIKNKYNVELYEIENSAKELEEITNQVNDLKIKLNTIEIEEKSVNNELDKLVNLEEEYNTLNEQLVEIEKKNSEINLTKELIDRAYEKMRTNISPKLTKRLSESMKKITNGKYENININDENGLIVEMPDGDYKPADRLSIGTIDQLYLSLRISMIEDISKEHMPIILDEAFAYYDDERLENILRYLTDTYTDHQIIIFTSTKREQEILNNINKDFNLITL